MTDAPRAQRAKNIADRTGTVARVERVLDAHLRSLRRKLERAVRRGEPLERLQARIRSEEELLRRMRAYEQGLGSIRRVA